MQEGRIYALVTRGELGATFLNGNLQGKSINFGSNTSWRVGGLHAPGVGKACR